MSDLAAKLAELRALAQPELDAPDDQGYRPGRAKIVHYKLVLAVIAMADCIEQIDSNGARVIDDALRELRRALSPNPPK